MDRGAATGTIASWLKAEHGRLHGEVRGPMSAVEMMREASAHDFDSTYNIPARKTEGHLSRARMRLMATQDDYLPETSGRGVSDLLKLVAGQQVKQALAICSSQGEFDSLVRYAHITTFFTESAVVPSRESAIPDLKGVLDTLDFKVEGSLAVIADRAKEGTDWGKSKSDMRTGAWLGEVACLDATFSVIEIIAEQVGGHEKVPLRMPGKDDEATPIVYPFMVGSRGLEPLTSSTSMRRSSQLS